jgi:hypothetical protein
MMIMKIMAAAMAQANAKKRHGKSTPSPAR